MPCALLRHPVIRPQVPIAAALVEIYGDALTDERIAELALALVPIEAAELAPSK